MVIICLVIIGSPSILEAILCGFGQYIVGYSPKYIWCDYRSKYPENGRLPVVTNGRYDHAECHHGLMTGIA
jgi:hypothetical protein